MPIPHTVHTVYRSRLGSAQITVFAALALVGTASLLCAAMPHALDTPPAVAQASTVPAGTVQQYQHDVLPVLQENCLRCHGGMNRRGGYNMSTRASALAGGHHGVAIVPGKPDESLLIKLIGPGPYPNDIKPMPLKGKLTDADIATLRQWVAGGAVMDQ